MRIRKALATGALLTAVVAVPTLSASAAQARAVHPDAFPCYGYGYGATQAEAVQVAREDMGGDVRVGNQILTTGQNPDGTWWAKISATCTQIL